MFNHHQCHLFSCRPAGCRSAGLDQHKASRKMEKFCESKYPNDLIPTDHQLVREVSYPKLWRLPPLLYDPNR